MTDYSTELTIAIKAATTAGDILRNAFNQPGGPTGTPHHADADDEAEQVIKAQLLDDFTDYGYLGEELGGESLSDASQIWVVDPNDGTSAYMAGYRGSAVSIALLEKDEPVLGVVYAFNYPDDNGDMICWAKGGPIMRNAERLERVWPAKPDTSCTVLVSHQADENAKANAECCSPMRYRALPSIAYRLALAAVGDGDVAVSLQSLSSWDVAAGHAILTGAGADVIDSSGNPYAYSVGHLKNGTFAFGGPTHLTMPLIGKPWNTVYSRPTRDCPYILCTPAHAGGTDSGMLARAQGCLLGQLAGDSLGSLVEFQSPGQIKQSYPQGLYHLADGGTFDTIAGQPTDDSEMALLLARVLISEGKYSPDVAREAYKFWLDSGPFDCGNTIASGLMGNINADSQANGAMMRISPLGIFGAKYPLEQVSEWAMKDAGLTHPHPVCLQANALFTTAISQAIATGSEPKFIYDQLVQRARDMDVDTALMDTILAAAAGPPEDYTHQMGWVLIAFQNALYQLLHAPSLEEGIVNTVMRGGDTDTNGAICGALLGAVYGRDAIPVQWMLEILRCRPITGQPNVRRSRPECFWPVDALMLAELLLPH